MKASIEVLYDRISNITIADFKINQAAKNIFHFTDLHLKHAVSQELETLRDSVRRIISRNQGTENENSPP